MLDHRIYTFLKLCDLMNYSATAQALNMTQPAVTQHMQYLEQTYACKLFRYTGKKLQKTKQAELLEQYARAAYYNELSFWKELRNALTAKIKIGATKTIGDYVIGKQLVKMMRGSDWELSLIIDNTERLLELLNRAKLDIALIEGFFDKEKYDYRLLGLERFVGICAKDHPFAGKEIALEDLFQETIIVREQGSGTRAIFEQVLHERNHSLASFSRKACISSFELIKTMVKQQCGISFVYEVIAKSDENLCSFTIKGAEVQREFNYVYLKNTHAGQYISILQDYIE